MPLTQSEKSKRYREKLKRTNPEKYLDMKKKNISRAIKAYHNKKKTLNDAHKEDMLENSIQPPVNTIQSTSSEQSANADNTENRTKRENNRETHNILATRVSDRHDYNETESRGNMYLNRTVIRRIQRNVEKKTRRENIELRENVQKLMRGYNTLKREMRKLKSDYRALENKVQEIEAKTESHAIGQGQDYTPFKRSEDFVNEHLTNVVTPVKDTIKRKILEYNVLTDSIKTKFKTSRNQEKNTFKDIVDNPMVRKYKLKSCLTKSLGLKNSLKRHRETKTKTRNRIETIRRFYETDDVSRASAGKKECRTYKKCKMQVRYLRDKLETLHKKYVSEVGPISYSTFKKYRPFYVISPDIKDLETCGCLKHCNMQFIVNALKSAGILQSNDFDTILANLVCDLHFRLCMYGECSVCKDNNIQLNTEENAEIKWFSWNVRAHEYDEKGEKKKTKRMTKTENKGTLKELVDLFNKEIKKFKIHVYNMRHQYQQYKLCLDSLDYNECALHIDFSENWLCKYHEEVQAMHFGASKRQITLHTGVLYIKNEKPLLLCTISAENSHNPEAIWAHLDPVLKHIRLTYPNIDTIHFFSDGPTTQYRQKKNFFLMTRNIYEHGFQNFTWSFFEASHGKGAADGVGGTIKRALDFKVSHGTDIPDAQTAFNLLQETATSIKLFYIRPESIRTLDTSITSKLTPIRNTLKIHQIVSSAKFILKHRILSCFCENLKGKCECFGPEIHSFEFDKVTSQIDTGLELDETTGELKQVREKRNKRIEKKGNEMFSEEEMFDWTQGRYLSDNLDIDETHLDVSVLNDSAILNAVESEDYDIGGKLNYDEKDNEVVIYNPGSLNAFCIKVINNYLILSDQNTTAQLSDVCTLNKISKGDNQNLAFKVMSDNDLPTCLQPEISSYMLSENETKVSAGCSKLIILSNLKVDVAPKKKKHDIKKILKGAEVITKSAIKTKIVPKKKDTSVQQNNALRETNTFNGDANTLNVAHRKRKQINETTETTSCGKKAKMNINTREKSKLSTSKEVDGKRKLKNITTETIISCREKGKKNTNSREKRELKSSKQTVKKQKVRTCIESSSSENSDILSLADTDNSEYGTFNEYMTSCLEDQVEMEFGLGRSDVDKFTREDDLLKADDWIVAKFDTKKSFKHFVGRVLSIKENIPTVKFVRKVKNLKGNKGLMFTYPNVEDVSEMHLNDVIKVLPQPNISRRGQIIFDTDISHYNIQ